MTKRERERLTALENILMNLGFTSEECDKLRRINSTLQRWYELECGTEHGVLARDEATNKPFWTAEVGNSRTGFRTIKRPIADRETGALRRLSRIISARNERMPPLSVVMLSDRAAPDVLTTYIQTDPRGAALYILRPGDIPEGYSVESCYTRGVCVF